MPDNLIILLTALEWRGPYVVVWLVGLVLAVLNWRKCPRPALLTALALVLLFASSAMSIVTYHKLVTDRADSSDEAFAYTMSLLHWGTVAASTSAYVLLLWAVFGWRQLYAPTRARSLAGDGDKPAAGAPAGGEAGSSDPNIRTKP